MDPVWEVIQPLQALSWEGGFTQPFLEPVLPGVHQTQIPVTFPMSLPLSLVGEP